MIALLLWLATLPPEPASRVAAHALGRPDLAPLVVAVTRRESRGVRVGVHECDRRWSSKAKRAAIRTRWLPGWCRDTWPGGWSTRGAHGLMAAYHLRYLGLGWTCSPWVLDVPIVSAIASVRKAGKVCRPRRPDRWCPRTPFR